MAKHLNKKTVDKFAVAAGFPTIDHAQRYGRPPGWMLQGKYYRTLHQVALICNQKLGSPLDEEALTNASIGNWLLRQPKSTLSQLQTKVLKFSRRDNA